MSETEPKTRWYAHLYWLSVLPVMAVGYLFKAFVWRPFSAGFHGGDELVVRLVRQQKKGAMDDV